MEATLGACEKFCGHFRNLQQVFLYITDQCNLECEQCIYKPHVGFDSFRHIPEETVRKLLATFHELGARKLTILGGEPTLYGFRDNHDPLIRTISYAKEIGFDYVRIDTNGQFSSELIPRLISAGLDEFAFSIDDCDPLINDKIRGQNTFKRSVLNLERCVAQGARATITCCIHRGLCATNTEGQPRLHDMIQFAKLLGCHTVNFHDLFKVGVPMDTWTGRLDPSPEEYVPVYKSIRSNIDDGTYFGINVRLPQCFVTKAEFQSNPEYFGYCPVKLGERVMVHADGIIRICSNLICTSWGTASFDDSKITWNQGSSNEMFAHKLDEMTPCTNRSKRSYGDLVPLCFSFKPDQEEFAWKRLSWDERRNVASIRVLS